MCVCVCIVVIPDARRIQAARRQRQAARAQKDYISLGRDGESSPRTPDQDLEERTDEDYDDDDEPDDHERRIEFAPRSKTIRERIAEKMGERRELREWKIYCFVVLGNS